VTRRRHSEQLFLLTPAPPSWHKEITMTNILHAVALTLRLLVTPADAGMATAEAICAEAWEPDSDGHAACTVGLESWRCEVQGWCSGGTSTVALMPLVDPAWAGRQEWR
jgi:hypothetical protein